MANLPNVSIREVSFSDLDAITSIRLSSFSDHDSAITCLGHEATLRFFKWLTTQPDVISLCAEIDGKLVGYAIALKPLDNRPFVRQNLGFFIMSVVTRPWLLGKPFFRRKIGLVVRRLKLRERPNIKEPKEEFKQSNVPTSRDDICNMFDTAVHPDYQGHGIGTLLLEARENEALRRGFANMRCSIRVNNQHSIKWHERHGYRVVSVERGDTVKMEKCLTASSRN